MARFALRRLAIIPVVLLLVNFVAYTYAHLVPATRAARTPYFPWQVDPGPLLPAYGGYLQDAVHLDFGTMPTGQAGRTVAGAIAQATAASLGLLALGLLLSGLGGVALGLIAVRVMPSRVARWLTYLSTVGLAMPSFYVGGLAVMAVFYYVLWRPGTGLPLPIRGFGWDLHLVLPVLVLVVRPTMHIARLTAGLLVDELGKRYVVTARSVGHGWGTIRWRHALRSILAPVILTVAGSVRLLMGELVLVEWLFGWPGLGLLLAQNLIPGSTNVALMQVGFLYPPVTATVITVFAAVFLVTDLVAAVLTHAADPRLRATEEDTTSADVVVDTSRSGRRNWALLIGGAIVLLVVAIAISGPALAPKDPLERHALLRVGDDWMTPSFPAFTVPGFPLGSDRFGRDLLSRLMWAVRPTMIMVAIVAFVRLVLGTLIGLGAGWSSGRVGRLLDMAIAVALSLPVLLVALFLIAATGIERGLLAFVIGLSVTGWAETARIVREQTQLIRGQQYVEAARALGQSDFRLLTRHVLRQIMPLIWILVAFEISGILMVTAGLGFLGYYIGGDLWVEIDDFIAQRISGLPELGQMLATANMGVTRLGPWGLPWAMLMTGSVIFVTILGFDLLGEGLRRQWGLEGAGRGTIVARAARRVGWWLEDKVWLPVARHPRWAYAALAAVLILVLSGALAWWRVRSALPSSEPEVILEVPGGHLWAAQGHDAHGTLYSDATGPTDPQVLWTFKDPAGFSGGPAVAADGTVYIASKGATLCALDSGGNLLWQASLPAAAVGVPALGAEGDVYVADKEGGLSAFTPSGDLGWRFEPETGGIAIAGPVAAPSGAIYYPIGDGVQAVSPDGMALWYTRTPQTFKVSPPLLDPAGTLLFWHDVALDAGDGSLQELAVPFDPYEYLVGADGRSYIHAGSIVMQWQIGESGFEIVETATWDHRGFTLIGLTPGQVGVTPDRVIWLVYSSMEDTRIAWLDTTGRVLGTLEHPLNRGEMIAVGEDATAYFCAMEGTYGRPIPLCFAYARGSEEPLWEVSIPGGERPLGGALVPGRLYVAFGSLDGDFLYAIGEGKAAGSAGTEPTARVRALLSSPDATALRRRPLPGQTTWPSVTRSMWAKGSGSR
jgi:ABC-type dipeptide/oligopeptide/nickel transport system permease subunit